MNCPNCNIEMNKGICLKCGYMENGNYIERFKKDDRNTDIRIYNEDYDEMNMNSKKIINLILGPLYFSYRNHLITGIIVSGLSLAILYFEILLTQSLLSLGNIFTLIAFFNTTFYILINRILYMGFSNSICLKLDRNRINKLKGKPNYMDLLVNHKNKSIAKIIINILIYIVIISIILFLK